MTSTRRALLRAAAFAAFAAAVPPLHAARRATARVVIVGGGFAGAACARTLRRFAPDIAVTLVEPRRTFITGPMSNAMLAGLLSERDVTHGPAALERDGVRWVRRHAADIDPVRRRVRLDGGGTLDADCLVVAPGIALRHDAIPGLDARASERMPHAWLGDAQFRLLRKRLHALRDGGTVAIAVPQNPYRCPPGPYERASLVAGWLAQHRPRSKLLLLDAKDDFSKRALFQTAWDVRYPGRIEWIPRAAGGELVSVDARAGTLALARGDRIAPALANVIPPQRAARIVRDADLADASGWCPVHAADFQSQRHAGVYVIGDASIAQPMPKSATAAHSQAVLCALAIAAHLHGTPGPDPRLMNTCYSLVAPDYGISVGGLYGAADGRLAADSEGTSPLAGDAALRALEAAQAHEWYRGIVRDSFGAE